MPVLEPLRSTNSVLPCGLTLITLESIQITIGNFEKMAKQTKKTKKKDLLEKREMAMVEGILEGSPDGIGVAIVRLDCGCRKMAAIDKEGEPASKIIMYRDGANTICDKCKDDQGAFMRITEQFIHWQKPEPAFKDQQRIAIKVMGTTGQTTH